MVIWLIGLSGSGKTTIGTALYERLKPGHANLVLVDGDAFREMMGNDLGHSREDRERNAFRFSHFCLFMDRQGIHLVCCVLSLFPEWQAWNRENLNQYFEIFLDVPLETLKKRDQKGLYKPAPKGKKNNVVGLDIAFDPPKNPDLVIDNSHDLDDISPLVDRIIGALPEFG